MLSQRDDGRDNTTHFGVAQCQAKRHFLVEEYYMSSQIKMEDVKPIAKGTSKTKQTITRPLYNKRQQQKMRKRVSLANFNVTTPETASDW